MSDDVELDVELRQVEAMLRRMPLRRPSEMLDERVRRVVRPRWGLALAVAATLTLVAGSGAVLMKQTLREREPGPAPVAMVQAARVTAVAPPIRMTQAVTGLIGRETVAVDGLGPIQRVRRVVVKRVKYVDAETGRTIWLTVPREEVVVVRGETF